MGTTALWKHGKPYLRRFGKLCLGGVLLITALCFVPPFNNIIYCLKVQAYLGSTTAMLKLVEIDGRHNFFWLRKAAEHGNAQAIFGVGNLDQPKPEALVWYKKGAELGDIGCMLEVSKAYDTGQYGIPIDKAEADRWLNLAKKRMAEEKQKRGGW